MMKFLSPRRSQPHQVTVNDWPLGVRLNHETLKVTDLTPGGQCEQGGAKVGMVVVGINDTALETNTFDAFSTQIKTMTRPFTLNFNALPEPKHEQEDEQEENTDVTKYEEDVLSDEQQNQNQYVEVSIEEGSMGIRLEDGTMELTELTPGGQCERGGAKLGMAIVGVNGESLEDQGVDTVDAFVAHIGELERPFTLNFNGLPQMQSEQAQEQEEEEEEYDTDFANLMAQGLEVNKHHRTSVFANKGKRVLYTDANHQTLICGKSKGVNTQKVYSVHEITNVGVSKCRGEEQVVVVQTKADQKALKLELPTAKSADLLAKKLTRMCSNEQRKSGGSVHCNTSSIPVSP